MSRRRSVCAALGGTAILLSASTHAATLFSDDFNRPLLNTPTTIWVGKDGTAAGTNGKIVADPLNAGNGVMNFTATNTGGDAFTATGVAFPVTGGVTYTLSFDYLGLPASNGAGSGGNGGFIGLTDGINSGSEYWVAGTDFGSLGGALDVTVTKVQLVDDNTWHGYLIDFTPQSSKTYYIKVEDFSLVGGAKPGDAYFDNISVIDPAGPSAVGVPTPAASIGGVALAGMLAMSRRRK
jgi:hypothetical protein